MRASRAAAALLACCALRAFPDASVVSGSGPDFPLDVDSVYFLPGATPAKRPIR